MVLCIVWLGEEQGHETWALDAAKLRWAKLNQVYRAEAERPWPADFVKVGTTAGTSFEDRRLASGKTCFYTVKAVAGDGAESEPSFRARTQPRVLPPPVVSEPLNVLCREQGESAEVRWDPNPEAGIRGYRLYELKGKARPP